jgi:hypothetical protein
MEYTKIYQSGAAILTVTAGDQPIGNEAQFMDVLSACGELECDRILFEQGSFAPAFFQLSTRLAGEILLKLSIYQLPAALVCAEDELPAGKFADFALETNRGDSFRIFTDRAKAVAWLAALSINYYY